MISQYNLIRLNKLIEQGDVSNFYHWTEWERLRDEVLRFDNYECQKCKVKGKFREAKVVHHVKPVKERPDLALSVWDGKERQLVSLCRACHEEEHPERIEKHKFIIQKKQITKERWD